MAEEPKPKPEPSSNSQDFDTTKKSFIKRFWWIFVLTLVLVLAIAVLAKPLSKMLGPKKEAKEKPAAEEQAEIMDVKIIDPENPPKFIQADFVELDKVYNISKFRSGMGHDYSYLSGETCRSMKHYFSSMDATQPVYKYEGLTIDKFPAPTVEKDVKIFSPVDGTLNFSDPSVSYNQELTVNPDSFPDIRIAFQHVQKAPGVKKGKVKAGELIGLVLANQSFDLAIQTDVGGDGEKKIGYISYFAAMPDSVFAKYQARGVKSRDDLIITKEYRDAHPFSCHDKEVFDKNYPQVDGRAAHIFDLSGYSEIDARINAKYPVKNIVKTVDTEN